MKLQIMFIILIANISNIVHAQKSSYKIDMERPVSISKKVVSPTKFPKSKVSFEDFMKVAKEVQSYRASRLLFFDKFMEMAKRNDVVILDARSKEMYEARHIKGAVNLNFSDFTEKNLAQIIGRKDRIVLIYCNNNFEDDQIYFPTKSILPNDFNSKEITLALNIPTFINLYGYGYTNVYELADLISVYTPGLELAGKVGTSKN